MTYDDLRLVGVRRPGMFLVLLCSALLWTTPRARAGPAQDPPATPAAQLAPRSRDLVPDPDRLAAASPELRVRLASDAFTYFRFVNMPWAQRVCEAFAADQPSLPVARLHGDAHVEQYALTTTARGLDDFDDSSFGPPTVDLVRFLGSIELAARARGWRARTAMLFDRFLAGYRAGLADGRYLPRDPSVVTRLRTKRVRTGAAFLVWAESLMEPPDARQYRAFEASLDRVDTMLRSVRPDLPAGYLRPKKIGWLRLGVGSAITPKVLARVEGPRPEPEDDVILEGKQLSDLRGVSCLALPRSREAFRVIGGAEQLGRLGHDILAVIPRAPAADPETPEWWVRSWEASYVEVTLRDYASVEELAEVVHDAGAQLGAGSLRQAGAAAPREGRPEDLEAIARLEPRIRLLATQLTRDLLRQWARFRAGQRSTSARPTPGP